MNIHKIVRLLGVSLALVSLLVFVTVASAAWHHHDSASESHCPYCHLGHQTAGQPETSQCIAALSPLASVPVSEDLTLASSLDFALSPSRAPPDA
jgi:hypothetical protein